MNTKERHIRENESVEKREEHMTPDQLAESLRAEGKERRNNVRAKSNRLWLWLGVLVLIFILIYWLFSIGIFGDLTNSFNG